MKLHCGFSPTPRIKRIGMIWMVLSCLHTTIWLMLAREGKIATWKFQCTLKNKVGVKYMFIKPF
jgi:hypothetical protein